MNDEGLKAVLDKHAMWLRDDPGGARADLADADLTRANLVRVNLASTNLARANLAHANLIGANLARANLTGANLIGANLARANLAGTNLASTVLDPCAIPNGDAADFERDGEFIIGYRTRAAGHIDMYRDGRYYSADWFSVCEHTECHPGLYLWPSLEAARNWTPSVEIIRVRTRPGEVHHVGSKWRCRWFEVLGSIEAE